jgi:hypothetical protein
LYGGAQRGQSASAYADNPRIIDLYFAPQRITRQVDHGAPELIQHHPSGLAASQRAQTLQK